MFKVLYFLKFRRLGLFPENACIAVDVVLKYWLFLLQVDIQKLLMISISHFISVVLHRPMLNQRMHFLRHILESLCIR